MTVTVNITDVAEAPSFAESSYAFDLAQNVDGTTTRVALGTVSATDPETASLTYSIEGGNSLGLFEIGASTGALSYKGTGEDLDSGTTSYELTVRASDGELHSDVTVTVSIDDFPASTSTAGRVVVGDSVTGNIGSVSDRDWFAVDLAEGSTYVIELKGRGTNYGTLKDPGLRGIYNPDGNHISGTSNDDAGEGWDSRVNFTPTESGTHFIAAGVGSRPVGTPSGTYTLAVSKVTDDLSADTETKGAVAVGGTATGEIEFANDVDWFSVTLESGKTYRFDLEGTSTNKGTLWSPYLRGLYDATGSRIDDTADNNGGVSRNAQLYFTPDTGDTYYVAAEAFGDLTGSYTLAVTETAEDIAGDISTTATVSVGGTAAGEIESPGDRDWFAVTLEAGKTYRFDLEGDPNRYSPQGLTLFDPYLSAIHDATGALIEGTMDDDGGGGRDSRLNFTVSTSGTYYVAVGANNKPYHWDTGSYLLSVADISVDVAADTSTTATVEVDGTATGNIETVRDRDWFSVTLEAGKTYRFDLEGSYTEKGTLSNPKLWGVYDDDGTRIDGTINGGGIGYNKHRYFTADSDGTYYVSVGAEHGPWVGSYTLGVTELAADVAAGTDSTATVAVGASVSGDIETFGDRDWFEVTLEAGKTYRIDLEGTPTRRGTLEEPYLRGIYDANGVLIDGTTDDDGGWINNSRVYFTASESGTYYVAASSAHDNYNNGQKSGGVAGTYTLSVTEIEADVAADTTTTATVTVGSTTSGEIDFAGDNDWYAVTLESGKSYRFDLEGRQPGGDLSKGTITLPHLKGIHDANGVLVDGTSEKNGYYSSQLYFTVATSGTYYVAASDHYGDRTGTYALTVTELEDDFLANISTTAAVAVGATATGEIDFQSDRDWFAVTLEAGKTYRFILEGESTDKGTLLDPLMRGLHDATGVLIDGTTDDDGAGDENSQVEFTAATSGTYFAAAGAFGDLTGSYTLAVEEVI